MQSIYRPSTVFDQRTNCHFNQGQLDELNRRNRDRAAFEIKPSSVAREVKARLDRKNGK